MGLANGWVLTADATDRFNHLVGRSHEATAGFIRTFVPGVAVRDALDGKRHRFLTATSIDRSPERALRRILGQRAREQMIATKLPAALRDLDRMLRREVDTALLDDLVAAPFISAPSVVPPAAPTGRPPTPPVISAPVPATPEEGPAPEATELLAAGEIPSHVQLQLSDLLRELVGSAELTVDGLAQLGAMAHAQRRAEAARERIRVRFEQLQNEVEAEQLELEIAQEELTTLQLEHATSEEERAEADRQLRFVRLELSKLGRPDVAWSEPDIDIRDVRPDTFAELLERCASLERIVFTGNVDTAQDLDRHGDRRSWAGKTWEALLVLEDYARLRVVDGFSRDVGGYLSDTPAGCRTFSANRHASTESNTVHHNPRYRIPRELPVPPEVDPTERAFMGAHFKIAQSARVSPRMHYLDATAATGCIYVGYIGPHYPLRRLKTSSSGCESECRPVVA